MDQESLSLAATREVNSVTESSAHTAAEIMESVWKFQSVLICRKKVVADLVQHYKTAFYASLVQGTPVYVFQHSRDAGSVTIISIHPPGSSPFDGFHFLYISGSVGDHTVEAYSNCSLISV